MSSLFSSEKEELILILMEGENEKARCCEL